MSTPFTPQRAQQVTEELETWFLANGKDYPWRRTRDPYAILVSEVMLQQTQITTVLDRGYYARWMTQFPSFKELAAATEEAVLKAWEGLGYYRRARNLQKLAQVIVAEHGGEMPRGATALLTLPGIGRYTAGAVSSFAYDESVPVVDGNVARVLSRLQNDMTPVDSAAGLKGLWEKAELLVSSAQSPRVLNSALMELGQTVCRTGQPDCLLCPLRAHCRAEDPAALPVKEKRTVLTDVTERVMWCRVGDSLLLEQESGARRTGLWKLPLLPEAASDAPEIWKTTYGITRYKVSLHVHEPDPVPAATKHQRFMKTAEIQAVAMASPYRKVVNKLLTGDSPADG